MHVSLGMLELVDVWAREWCVGIHCTSLVAIADSNHQQMCLVQRFFYLQRSHHGADLEGCHGSNPGGDAFRNVSRVAPQSPAPKLTHPQTVTYVCSHSQNLNG